MAKVTANNIVKDMVFEIISQDDLLSFGMLKGEECSIEGRQANSTIGSKVIITKIPYKKYGSQLVDWKFKDADNTEFVSYWSIFRNNTKLIEGEVIETKQELKGLSNGKYAGFDMEIHSVNFNDYTEHLGFGQIVIRFKFIGEIQGAKQINTKIINQIKRSSLFKEDFITMILTVVEDTHRENTMKSLNDFSAKKCRACHHEPYTSGVCARYSGGKLEYTISMLDNKLDKIRDNVFAHVDRFIDSNNTSV